MSRVASWTGQEVIACCRRSVAASYDPSTGEWSTLPPAPLVPVAGAWTGRELVVLDRRGNAAAYQPGNRRWRPIAPLPAPRNGVSVVWDGLEVLVVGGSDGTGPLPAVGYAYDPAKNRWRTLPPMESGRRDAAAVWTGTRLLLWGGVTGRPGALAIPPHGLAYDPATNSWSALPKAPLLGRIGPKAAWTGRAMLVWGGSSGDRSRVLNDGAAFAPAR
jgi:N-acetylneuraminic acid mutarotase